MRLIRENVFKQQKPTLRLQAVLLINTSSNINIQDLGTLSWLKSAKDQRAISACMDHLCCSSLTELIALVCKKNLTSMD